MAENLGAIGYKSVRDANTAWYNEDGSYFGGRGFELLFEDGNRIYLDAGDDEGTIYVAQIKVMQKSNGLGSRAIEIMRQYALENHYDICIYKVSNRNYFRKISWLKEDSWGNFVYKFKMEHKKEVQHASNKL